MLISALTNSYISARLFGGASKSTRNAPQIRLPLRQFSASMIAIVAHPPGIEEGARQVPHGDIEVTRAGASRLTGRLVLSSPANPIYQPTKFESVINLKAAKTLGLTTPPALLATACEVIQ
jgi:hypothetical protein